jgi:hypothetical protein
MTDSAKLTGNDAIDLERVSEVIAFIAPACDHVDVTARRLLATSPDVRRAADSRRYSPNRVSLIRAVLATI